METLGLWPWLAQVVPWLIGGAGIAGLLGTALQMRQEHQRWLRDQKKAAYQSVLGFASEAKSKIMTFAKLHAEHQATMAIYKTGDLKTPVNLPSVGNPTLNSMGDLDRANQKLEQLMTEAAAAYVAAISDVNDWSGPMELLAPKKVTKAFGKYVEALGEGVDIRFEVEPLDDSLTKTHSELVKSIRKDYGIKK